MTRCVYAATALAVVLAVGVADRAAQAQSGRLIRNGQSYSANRYALQTPEELPTPGAAPIESMPEFSGGGAPGYYVDGAYPDGPGGFGHYGFDDYGYGGPGCGDGCDFGYDYGYDTAWWDFFDFWQIAGSPGVPRRWYFTADYLYVRANFSEATAFVEHVPPGAGESTFRDTFHELDFRHDSSYRFGAGYQLGCCDEQVRFQYTRLSSYANALTTNEDAIGPFETSPGPGGSLNVFANVNANSYDLEYAKTIPLGGNAVGCCDPCGCGDPCGCTPSCPAWDITWSGGLRFADVDWVRSYVGTNPQTEETRTTLSTMDFSGGGPRVGLEGRRYFGQNRWCSMFLKGDLSLLLGNAQFNASRVTDDGTPPTTINLQSANFRNIIPVTEIEAGMTAQLTGSSVLSTGYLFSAWHDLGFRDQFAFATFLETNYDDANILGFDGFFVRLEVAY